MTEFPEDSPRAREDREVEDWLRRELDFLHGVERRVLRRARMCEAAWRAAAVAFIFAIFACCWYLAALCSAGSTRPGCPSAGSTAGVGSGGSVRAAAGAHASYGAKAPKPPKPAKAAGATAAACAA